MLAKCAAMTKWSITSSARACGTQLLSNPEHTSHLLQPQFVTGYLLRTSYTTKSSTRKNIVLVLPDEEESHV